jgi:hypothetical protein
MSKKNTNQSQGGSRSYSPRGNNFSTDAKNPKGRTPPPAPKNLKK